MFYTKYNNTHITDDIKNLPINDLKIKDNVVLLSGDEVTSTFNCILNEISYGGKIYKFKFNENNKNDGYRVTYNSANVSWDFEDQQNTLYMYLNDNYLVNLFCESNYKSFWGESQSDLFIHIYKTYISKGKHGTIYSGDFTKKAKDIEIDIKGNKIDVTIIHSFIYLIIPLDDEYSMILINNNNYNINQKAVNNISKVTFIKTSFSKTNNKQEYESQLYACISKSRTYNVDIIKIFNNIKNFKKQEYKSFEENLFAFNYDLKTYLQDHDKETNIEKVSKIITKIYKCEFNLKNYYKPIFVDKSTKIKSYQFNNDIYITLNDKIISYGEGEPNDFKEKQIYLGNGLIYKTTVEEEIKNSKKKQLIYRTAYQIAKFNKYKNGFDPKTGKLFYYGEEITSNLVYQDNDGLILKDAKGNTFYLKKYGYYIEVNNDEAKELNERYLMTQKLKESR